MRREWYGVRTNRVRPLDQPGLGLKAEIRLIYSVDIKQSPSPRHRRPCHSSCPSPASWRPWRHRQLPSPSSRPAWPPSLRGRRSWHPWRRPGPRPRGRGQPWPPAAPPWRPWPRNASCCQFPWGSSEAAGGSRQQRMVSPEMVADWKLQPRTMVEMVGLGSTAGCFCST